MFQAQDRKCSSSKEVSGLLHRDDVFAWNITYISTSISSDCCLLSPILKTVNALVRETWRLCNFARETTLAVTTRTSREVKREKLELKRQWRRYDREGVLPFIVLPRNTRTFMKRTSGNGKRRRTFVPVSSSSEAHSSTPFHEIALARDFPW